MKCEREQQVIEAMRNGLWSAPLRAHVRDCVLCTQTKLIAEALQEDGRKGGKAARSSAGRYGLAPRSEQGAHPVLCSGPTRRPFLIVGALGSVYSVGIVLWGILQLPQFVYRPFVATPGLTGGVVLAGAALSAILAIAGSCVLVLAAKR